MMSQMLNYHTNLKVQRRISTNMIKQKQIVIILTIHAIKMSQMRTKLPENKKINSNKKKLITKTKNIHIKMKI